MKKLKIINTDISEITLYELTELLLTKKNLNVAVCNANSVVRAKKNSDLQNILNSFDICTPDGFPIALASRILYKNTQKRVDGFKIFNNTLISSKDKNVSHFLYGNTAEVCEKIIEKSKYMFPGVNILGYYAPSIKDFDKLAEETILQEIIDLKPDIIWVSLGFPKQELFINQIRKIYNTNTNLVGVGFTFDWTAGTKMKAPEWAANLGLEWVLRLIQEPRRLAKRYFVDNFLFIVYFIKQLTSKSKTL